MQNTQNLDNSVWENRDVWQSESNWDPEEDDKIVFQYTWDKRISERLRIELDNASNQVIIGGSVVENLEGWSFELDKSIPDLNIKEDFLLIFYENLQFEQKEENLIKIKRYIF
jgi:hypothetical protein